MKLVYSSSLLAILLLSAAGCPSPNPLSPYNSNQAEETLVLVLDAWKQGQAGALAKRKSPIRFEDEDYRNGSRLADYRIEKREMPLRPFNDVRVALSLRDRKGRKINKTVAYQIKTAPNLAVLRSD